MTKTIQQFIEPNTFIDIEGVEDDSRVLMPVVAYCTEVTIFFDVVNGAN
jgi:hypothetical protein